MVFKFSKQQQKRLVEIYDDTTIATKDICNVIKDEMGYEFPYEQVKHIYNELLQLPLRKRKRKDSIVIEFEEDEEDEEDTNVPVQTVSTVHTTDNW